MTTSRAYFHDLSATATLSEAEQDALARRYARTRDPADARRLVLANLRLVVALARTLSDPRRADWMDLVQEDNVGLMIAIDRFDPGRGPKLSAYAAFWIRGLMLRHLMEAGHVVRSTTTREGRRRFFQRAIPSDVSLDAPVARDDDRPTALLDRCAGEDGLRPDIAVQAREEGTRAKTALARLDRTLSERERTILRSRLLTETPRPLRALGASLALSGERVRQVEQDLVKRLRALAGEPERFAIDDQKRNQRTAGEQPWR